MAAKNRRLLLLLAAITMSYVTKPSCAITGQEIFQKDCYFILKAIRILKKNAAGLKKMFYLITVPSFICDQSHLKEGYCTKDITLFQ